MAGAEVLSWKSNESAASGDMLISPGEPALADMHQPTFTVPGQRANRFDINRRQDAYFSGSHATPYDTYIYGVVSKRCCANYATIAWRARYTRDAASVASNTSRLRFGPRSRIPYRHLRLANGRAPRQKTGGTNGPPETGKSDRSGDGNAAMPNGHDSRGHSSRHDGEQIAGYLTLDC